MCILEQKKNKDISAETLKKVVKASGDECVTGYVRFRKIKPCKGYKAAEKRAEAHISKITAGRPLEDGKYAAVVRFRLLPLLIPIAAFMLILGIVMAITPKAAVREKESEPETEASSAEYIIPPEEVTSTENVKENEYAGLYISVPGYTEFRLDSQERGISLYNPPDNECVLQYYVYIKDRLVASSGVLASGDAEKVDFYDVLTAGKYTVKLVAQAYSKDGKTRFNSVSQQITLIKE